MKREKLLSGSVSWTLLVTTLLLLDFIIVEVNCRCCLTWLPCSSTKFFYYEMMQILQTPRFQLSLSLFLVAADAISWKRSFDTVPKDIYFLYLLKEYSKNIFIYQDKNLSPIRGNLEVNTSIKYSWLDSCRGLWHFATLTFHFLILFSSLNIYSIMNLYTFRIVQKLISVLESVQNLSRISQP